MLLERELRVGSRRAITYWGRICTVAIGIIFVWQQFASLDNGIQLFELSLIIGGGLCILDVIRRASASIAEEKREGTIGLLLLTPLSGGEVLRGKLASVLVSSFPIAFALMPLFALSVLLGGVSGGEVFRCTAALLHCMNLAACAGVLISTKFRNATGAFFATVVILIVGAIGLIPFLGCLPLTAVNPLTPLIFCFDTNYTSNPHMFWISLVASQGAAFWLMWINGKMLHENLKFEEELYLATEVRTVPIPISNVSFANEPRDFAEKKPQRDMFWKSEMV